MRDHKARVTVIAASIVAVLSMAACMTTPPARQPLTSAVTPSSDLSHGAVSLRIIPDPNAHPTEFAPDERFVAPRISCEPALPEYPPDALAAREAPARVVLRITIGPSGRVEQIEDSPVAASTPGPFAAEFRWAAVRAVRRWRFTPGRVDRVMSGAAHGDGALENADEELVERIDVGEPLAVFYDIRFDFEIVAGEGRVGSSLDHEKPLAPD